MMNEDQQLRDAVKWQRKPDPDRAVRLGNVTMELMKNRISPQQARFGPIAELWTLLLPDELRRHCKIVGFYSGQLKVQVDSPAYMYELKLCSSELLSEMQQQCPRTNIKKIKLVVGSLGRS